MGEPLGWDNIAAWRLAFKRHYANGELGDLREQTFIAATSAAALAQLQQVHVGCGVAELWVYRIDSPLTRDEVAAIKAANAELAPAIDRYRAEHQEPQV